VWYSHGPSAGAKGVACAVSDSGCDGGGGAWHPPPITRLPQTPSALRRRERAVPSPSWCRRCRVCRGRNKLGVSSRAGERDKCRRGVRHPPRHVFVTAFVVALPPGSTLDPSPRRHQNRSWEVAGGAASDRGTRRTGFVCQGRFSRFFSLFTSAFLSPTPSACTSSNAM